MSATLRWLGVVLTAALLWGGCSERITDDRRDDGNLRIALDRGAALSLAATPSVFRVTVTDLAGDTVAQQPLIFAGTDLYGTVKDLPANKTLQFVVEALEEGSGTVLYRGTTAVYVSSTASMLLSLDLHPVAPLIKFTPRYEALSLDSTFWADTKLFNVPNMYGISYRVSWPQDVVLTVDSVIPSHDLDSDTTVIFFAQQGVGAQPYYAFSITATNTTSDLAGADGDVSLARMYFHYPNPIGGASSISLTLEVTSITQNNGGQIDSVAVSSVYTDECLIDNPWALISFR